MPGERKERSWERVGSEEQLSTTMIERKLLDDENILPKADEINSAELKLGVTASNFTERIKV